jgi:hypothetical protein
MANLSDFMPHVMIHVPGCSYPLAEQAVRGICIDFCSKATIAQVSLDAIGVIANKIEYDLEPPYDTSATLILDAYYMGNKLSIFKLGDSDRSRDKYSQSFLGVGVISGTPSSIRQTGDATFIFDVAPLVDIDKAVSLIVAVKPKNNAATVPDILLNDYAYEIGLGAASRLMSIQGQGFYNPAQAADFRSTYEIARTGARIRAEASFGRSNSVVSPRRFI